jgi:hypothetical protein
MKKTRTLDVAALDLAAVTGAAPPSGRPDYHYYNPRSRDGAQTYYESRDTGGRSSGFVHNPQPQRSTVADVRNLEREAREPKHSYWGQNLGYNQR